MARKPGASGAILAAVVLGVVTAILFWNYLRKQEENNRRNWLPVVVAISDIKANAKITREMIRLEQYPKDLIAENAITKIEDAVDRVAQNPVSSKSQVRNTDLLAPGQAPKISLRVPDGMRAVAIAASEVASVGNGVQPGDRIDLIATYTDPQTRRETTKMILQYVLVLAVNQAETESQTKVGAKSSMTLAVKPEQTELVKAAERSGSLSVSLRSATDDKIIPTDGADSRQFSGDVGPVTPVNVETNSAQTPVIFFNAPPAPRPVKDSEIKVIRSTSESTVIINR